MNTIRIIFIITDLFGGGAEVMLYKLLSRIDRSRFEPAVISLINKGALGAKIEALDIPVFCLEMRPGTFPTIKYLWRLLKNARHFKPHIIQGWMYHGNAAAAAAKSLSFSQAPLLWNIHASRYYFAKDESLTNFVIWLGARLSGMPNKILNVSRNSMVGHDKIGYPSNKTVIIPNGFDTAIFRPCYESRVDVRQELGIPSDSLLIGLISRYHPVKDHLNFFQAAQILSKHYSNVYFLLAGRSVDEENRALIGMVQDLKIRDRVFLLGERPDVVRLTASLDIAALSSYTEAFPNVIGEAMACGVPCAVTDVGDCGWMVGATGRIVPPRNPEALATGCKELIDLGAEGRKKLGEAARQRIIENFSLDSVVKQYEKLYEGLLCAE